MRKSFVGMRKYVFLQPRFAAGLTPNLPVRRLAQESAGFLDGALAQSVEQQTENLCVPGSIPGGTTLESKMNPF